MRPIMAFRSQLSGALLVLAAHSAASPAIAQENGETDPLGSLVLRSADREVTAREVVEAICKWDPSIRKPLEGDPDYRALYLSSVIFRDQVRAYRDQLLLDSAGFPAAETESLHKEALAWATDRNSPQPTKVLLTSRGLEIEVRTRLLSSQPKDFSTLRLRQHLMASVPEFFGLMSCSWIRVPLFNPTTGSALPEEEVKARWIALTGVSAKVKAGDLEWNDAVMRWSEDSPSKKKQGKIGILQRNMTDKFEEPFLRQLFAGHGFKHVEEHQIRGPILGDWWIYLARIETIHIKGPVGLEQVRAKVKRSLREHLLQERMQEFRAKAEYEILVPPVAYSVNE